MRPYLSVPLLPWLAMEGANDIESCIDTCVGSTLHESLIIGKMFACEKYAIVRWNQSFPEVKPLTWTIKRVGALGKFISLPGIALNRGTFDRRCRANQAQVLLDELPQIFRARCRKIVCLVSNRIAAQNALGSRLPVS